mmetsp:Transcript_95438/g.256258  ORF Transcript_95438/g.256258 Transcript_95438/m.256258 type:complete len:745 (+) Transcript_95438:90-2324(+)
MMSALVLVIGLAFRALGATAMRPPVGMEEDAAEKPGAEEGLPGRADQALPEGSMSTPHRTPSKDHPASFSGTIKHVFMGSPSSRTSFAVGCALLVGVLIFEVFHKRTAEFDLSAPFSILDKVEDEQDRAVVGPLQGAVTLLYLYAAESQTIAMVFIGLIGATIIVSQYLSTLLVSWTSVFWEDMEEWGKGSKGDSIQFLDEFRVQLLYFLFLALVHLVASAYQQYVVTMFSIHVRAKVTRRYASQWMQDFVYYRLELYRLIEGGADADNPDQRIQEDAEAFISGSIRLLTGFISNLIQLGVFSVTVWNLSPEHAFGVKGLRMPGWLLVCELGYAVLSTAVVRGVSIKLEALQAANQRAEADFRWELTTVRRNSEGIALGRGEMVHQERINSRFDVIRRCVWENMIVQKRYSMIYSLFSQVEVVVTLFLLGPAFLRGEATLGTVMAVNRATGLLSGSLFWFAGAYGSIANWRASTGRLIRFEEAMSRHLKVQAGAKVDLPKSAANGLEISDLKVWTPAAIASPSSKELCHQEDEQLPEVARVVLLEGLSLSIPAGSRLLISGPSGAGKSTLLRALSGAWPWAEGGAAVQGGPQGMLVFPAEVLALPGQLREAVAYPLPLDGNKAARETQEHLDKDIAAALRVAGLARLLEDGLGCRRDWGLALSSGQKARLSLARLVFHRPRVAALDEPVAHLDMPARAPLLKAALGALPETTVLVISHDVTEEIQELFSSKFALDVENKSLRRR